MKITRRHKVLVCNSTSPGFASPDQCKPMTPRQAYDDYMALRKTVGVNVSIVTSVYRNDIRIYRHELFQLVDGIIDEIEIS